ncbi:MAG: hypothetical protein ACRD9Q_01440, partial [Nitrososphaeraceae archaeon]
MTIQGVKDWKDLKRIGIKTLIQDPLFENVIIQKEVFDIIDKTLRPSGKFDNTGLFETDIKKYHEVSKFEHDLIDVIELKRL